VHNQQQYYQGDHPEPKTKKSGKKKAAIVLIVIFSIVTVVAVISFFFLRHSLGTPPDMRAYPRGPERLQVSGGGGFLAGGGIIGGSSVRDTSKYTFLILGVDDGEANTDVIMVVTFDTAAYTLDVVSIPRDTMVNVSWRLRKANSILANMRVRHRGEDGADAKAMDSTVEMFADILGFEVDYWVRVNMNAFVSLIDAIGGVEFYVPVDMNYTDRYAGLSIQYTRGVHHLSGQQALEVVRFRSYRTGDIGRIGTQQSFLQTAAGQILENRGSLSVLDLANVFINDVVTDLTLSDLIWFGREFMRLDADNISFHTMPGNIADSVGRMSYVTIFVDEWLELVNDVLNPFHDDFTPEDVSILTRGANRRLYVTDGNWRGDANWGS